MDVTFDRRSGAGRAVRRSDDERAAQLQPGHRALVPLYPAGRSLFADGGRGRPQHDPRRSRRSAACGSPRGRRSTPMGRLPYTVDVEDRLPYAIGASAKYSTTNGPAGQVYWEDRNVFGGAERLRLQADIFYAPPWYVTSTRTSRASRSTISAAASRRASSSPPCGARRNDLLVDALGERVSTAGAGFFGYEAEDADATAALRHRFSQNFWVQAGIEGADRRRDGLARAGRLHAGRRAGLRQLRHDRQQARSDHAACGSTPRPAALPNASARPSISCRARRAPRPIIRSTRTRASCSPAASGSARWAARTLDDIPANWRFYAGGGGSVRGYAYNSLGPTGPSAAVIGGRSLFDASAELRVRVTDTIGIVPFFDAGNAFATEFPQFQRAALHGGRPRPALLHGDRPDPARCRLSAPARPRQRPGGASTSASGRLSDGDASPSPSVEAGGAVRRALVLFAPARADQADKGVLADLISRALSSPSTTVSIGAVEGVLSSDVTISDIVLSDRDGPWLKIDKVRLIWNRLALFSRRLEVDQLTIGHMQCPAPAPALRRRRRRRERGRRSRSCPNCRSR